ncbi:MAG: hypothetical protein AB8G05_17095 [Oligoflexales bacterium]
MRKKCLIILILFTSLRNIYANNYVYIYNIGILTFAEARTQFEWTKFQCDRLLKEKIYIAQSDSDSWFAPKFVFLFDLKEIPYFLKHASINAEIAIKEQLITEEKILEFLEQAFDEAFAAQQETGKFNIQELRDFMRLDIFHKMINKLKPITNIYSTPMLGVEGFYGQYNYYQTRGNIFFNELSDDHQAAIFTNLFFDHRYLGFGGGYVSEQAGIGAWFKAKSDIAKLGFSYAFPLSAGSNNSLVGVSAYLQGWSDKIGGSVAAGYLSPTGHIVSSGIYYRNTHSQTFQYLKPYKGKNHSLQNYHKIQLKDANKHKYRFILGGASSMPISPDFGAWVAYESVKKSIYRIYTRLKNAQSYQKVADKTGFKKIFSKSKKNEPLNLLTPLKWIKGEEAEKIVQGKIYGGGVMGIRGGYVFPAAHAGIAFELKGLFSIKVRKLKNKKIFASLEIKEIKEWGPFLSLLGAYKCSFSSNLAAATSYSYEFDFEKEGSEESYIGLLRGKIPGLSESFLVKFEDDQKKSLLRYFASQKKSLASRGICLLEMQHTYLPSHNTWSGVDIEWLPHNDKWTGLGVSRTRAKGYSLITNGRSVTSHKIILRQKVKEKLYNGNYLVAMSAMNKRKYEQNNKNRKMEKVSEELELTALIKDSYLRTAKQDRIANYLNKLFHTKIPKFRYDVGHEIRQVELRQVLSSSELQKLKATPKNQFLIFSQAGIKEKEIAKLVNELQSHSSHDTPKPILAFILKTGINGFALLHRVLGMHRKKLYIITDCDIYSDPIDEAKNIILKYTRNNYQYHRKKIKLRIGDNSKVIETAFQTFYNTIAQLNEAINKLKHDPFIRYELNLHNTNAHSFYYYHAHKLSLLAARTHLLALFDLKRQGVSLDKRLSIYNQIKTKRYRNLAYYLEYDDLDRIQTIGL